MSSINPPLKVIKMEGNHDFYSGIDIAGYTCIENDILFKDFKGELGIGDFIEISNCGSYSVVMKPPFIFPNVPILDISGNSIELIKRAENFDDLFNTYEF